MCSRERAGLDVDRAGRVEVLEDLSLPGHPEVLAIGDMVRIRQGGRDALLRCPELRRLRCSRAATPPASCATV